MSCMLPCNCAQAQEIENAVNGTWRWSDAGARALEPDLRTRIAQERCGSCTPCVAVRQGETGTGYRIRNGAPCEAFPIEELAGCSLDRILLGVGRQPLHSWICANCTTARATGVPMEYVLHHGCIFGVAPHRRAAHQYIESPTGAHLYGDWIPDPRDVRSHRLDPHGGPGIRGITLYC